MCIPCCFTISTAEVGVIESWGKFNRLAQPGLGFVLCPMEQLVGRLSFRVQQIDVRVETKTLDNVFLTAVVSVQVRKPNEVEGMSERERKQQECNAAKSQSANDGEIFSVACFR
jgi:regulator of protease activity HflC (stomatin/prohibitin superfamily)